MHNAKQDAIEAIERLPDDVHLENVYRLHVLSKIQQGVRDVDAGNAISSQQLAEEIERW